MFGALWQEEHVEPRLPNVRVRELPVRPVLSDELFELGSQGHRGAIT